MKNNNRNRKLRFIKTKNALRLGKRGFFVFQKVTDEYLKNLSETDLEKHLENYIDYAKKQLLRIYRLSNLNNVTYDIGQDSDDFIKDMKTERIELRKYPR